MIAFLNAANADLGGRPLDLAVDSDEGLEAVLRLLRASGERAAPVGPARRDIA